MARRESVENPFGAYYYAHFSTQFQAAGNTKLARRN
jgi:hypothetical protein